MVVKIKNDEKHKYKSIKRNVQCRRHFILHLTKRRRVWGISMKISGFCGYGNSVGIPTGFSMGMGWVWELKSNSHGSRGVWGRRNLPQWGLGSRSSRSLFFGIVTH